MKLLDLEPKFLRWERRRETVTVANDPANFPIGGSREEERDQLYYIVVDTLAEAWGVEFLCPKCFEENKGPVGTHMVICWSPVVPLDISPGPGRWELKGTGLHDLSLVAGSSSVKLEGGCNAHFMVENGETRNC